MADSYRFDAGPPQEVISYIDEKALVPSFSYKDVWGAQHAHSFTVAKAMQLDVLAALQDATKRAIRDGVPYDQFAKELTPRLQEMGWWGTQLRIDPVTGEERLVRLGSPRRLKVIYHSNTRAARAAGQWHRSQRTKRMLPFFLYGIGNSENHRPHHVAEAGTIKPVDDPHWDYWFPPNGWGCNCWIRQISQYEADSLGGVTDTGEPAMRSYTNNRTGETVRIPVGIDPGWHRNPGKDRFGTLRRDLGQTMLEAEPAIRRAAIVSSPLETFADAAISGAISGNVSIPFASVDAPVANALGTKGRVAFLSADAIARHRGTAATSAAQYAQLMQGMIDEGEIYREPNGRISVIREIDGYYWLLGLRISKADEMFVRTFHPWRMRSIRAIRRKADRVK
ncbi:MAG: hypothetical protein JJ926_03860 [Roseitalea sp.]|nr:hypothetical protein [Roseitalea sp.]MBO6950992.1 hypothetical protein [Rhizobiaceae bacterium]MBO6591021.1 hypothetical protein [Roseitalea sp.]MBO6599721.1 hypothetical protein [Roseitalea sp.]MBO6611477.1 hypothetical protein [Roseitalea sp.]